MLIQIIRNYLKIFIKLGKVLEYYKSKVILIIVKFFKNLLIIKYFKKSVTVLHQNY